MCVNSTHSGSGLSHFYQRSLLNFVCHTCSQGIKSNLNSRNQSRLLKLDLMHYFELSDQLKPARNSSDDQFIRFKIKPDVAYQCLFSQECNYIHKNVQNCITSELVSSFSLAFSLTCRTSPNFCTLVQYCAEGSILQVGFLQPPKLSFISWIKSSLNFDSHCSMTENSVFLSL